MSRTRLHILVLALSLAGYGWIAWHALQPYDAPRAGIHGIAGAGYRADATPCPVKLSTGLPCPSCGTTRAVVALAGGDVAGSLATNPLGLLAVLALVVFPPWVLHDQFRGRGGFHRFYAAAEGRLQRSAGLAAAGILLVLANWGWNVLKGL